MSLTHAVVCHGFAEAMLLRPRHCLLAPSKQWHMRERPTQDPSSALRVWCGRAFPSCGGKGVAARMSEKSKSDDQPQEKAGKHGVLTMRTGRLFVRAVQLQAAQRHGKRLFAVKILHAVEIVHAREGKREAFGV
jgi:hypothetical protein